MNNKVSRRDIITGIYLITNKINGKKYIGQSIDIYARWNSYKSMYRDINKKELILKAMREFGFNNFKFEIIHKCKKQELNRLEIEYIKQYNSFIYSINSNGYNANEGGSVNNSKPTQRVKCIDTEKVYDSAKEAYIHTGCSDSGILKCCRGNQLSCKDKNKHKLRWEFVKEIDIEKDTLLNYIKDSTFQNDIKIKICEYITNSVRIDKKIKRGGHNKIKVICKETKEVFDSLVSAGKSIGVSGSSISANINKKQDKVKSKKNGEYYTFAILDTVNNT